jgi:hypothetical protein
MIDEIRGISDEKVRVNLHVIIKKKNPRCACLGDAEVPRMRKARLGGQKRPNTRIILELFEDTRRTVSAVVVHDDELAVGPPCPVRRKNGLKRTTEQWTAVPRADDDGKEGF